MTSAMEIGLILQGGGALGAYEWGGILALFDLMDEAARAGRNVTLRVVTGVSIGAINAACVVGASDRNDARQRLGALWNDFMIKAPAFVPAAVTSNVALFEVPHFYRFAPSWNFTYLYQTKALLDTLSEHVDFAALNANRTAFVVTAVDVKSGQLTWFANQKRRRDRAQDDRAKACTRQRQLSAAISLDENRRWQRGVSLLGRRPYRQHAARRRDRCFGSEPECRQASCGDEPVSSAIESAEHLY